MSPLICKQCGGKIDPVKMVCEYCGTSYNDCFPRQIKYVVEQPNVHTLATNITVPMEVLRHVDAGNFSKHIVRDMSSQLAEAIAPYLTIDVEDDPYTMEKHVRGKIRVLDPKFRYT